MIKLYKKINNVQYYWETWDVDKNTSVIHWGMVGEEGENKIVKSSILKVFNKEIKKELDSKINDGYQPLDDDQVETLIIEYKIDGFGSENDFEKRTRLQDSLNEFLGWRGLGNCDGGSTGSGTMEVFCLVTDYKIAYEKITKFLEKTEFSDYVRIYNEER